MRKLRKSRMIRIIPPWKHHNSENNRLGDVKDNGSSRWQPLSNFKFYARYKKQSREENLYQQVQRQLPTIWLIAAHDPSTNSLTLFRGM